MSPPAYYFGVEIELIATPIKIQYPTHRAHYYTKLAKALRSCGAKAISDSLEERYRKHPEHYDKWWITKDGSLGSPPSPQSRYPEAITTSSEPLKSDHPCQSP